tara:strand:+ start:269 stop:445 length:177 start_codon:yes stop_codon:yes gene_type:complete
MKDLLTKHPREQGMTYFQHMVYALSSAVVLAGCAIVLVFHAFFPFLMETYSSDRVDIK